MLKLILSPRHKLTLDMAFTLRFGPRHIQVE
jgi:hypothetical protein